MPSCGQARGDAGAGVRFTPTGPFPKRKDQAVLRVSMLLVVAAALRIAWAAFAARPPSQSLHDPNFYLFYGEQIANGNGYVLPNGLGPSAYFPVGYPIGNFGPVTRPPATSVVSWDRYRG